MASVTAAVIVAVTMIPLINQSSQVITQSQRNVGRQIGTNIQILGVVADASGSRLDAWIKNVGLVDIDALSNTDVFIITPGARYDRLLYDVGGGHGTWKELPVGSKWSRGDSLHIEMVLAPDSPIQPGLHTLKIVTSNGISNQETFSR